MNNQWTISVAINAPMLPHHSYGVDGEGREIPSVTKIVNPKPYVGGYSTPAMQTGTRMHQQLEDVLHALSHGERLTKKLCGGDETIYMMAMMYRRKIHAPKASVETEVSFIAELSNGETSYSYAGTMDVMESASKGTLVIDWKTGKPHAWHRLQVSAYMLAVGATSGALVYPDKIEWVEPITCDEMAHLIMAYHARQAIAIDKKKVMVMKSRAWQRGQAYAV